MRASWSAFGVGRVIAVGWVVGAGEGVTLGARVAVGGAGVKVGALVAVSDGGNVPQEVSRRDKISHCNVRFFIILNFLVISAIILRN
jgi:hypothetical protein